MNNIRKLIKKLIKEEIELQTDFGNPDKAKRSIIAFSKGLISKSDFKVKFLLISVDPEETGTYYQEGQVEIEYLFEGTKYNTILEIEGEFYFTEASFKGDYWQPEDPNEYEAVDLQLKQEDITISDEERNDYEFLFSNLGPNFGKELSEFLLDYYDPEDV